MIEAQKVINCNYKMDSENGKSLEIVGKILPLESTRMGDTPFRRGRSESYINLYALENSL